jgi:hypothetical protein
MKERLTQTLKFCFRAESFGLWVLGWFYLRIGVGLIHACAPVSSPHIWRQVDTLSVSLRYYLRWFQESGDSGYIIPGVLNSGDGLGLHVMEFPFLNFAGAPFFAFGLDSGRTLVHLLMLCLVVAITVLNFRLWTQISEIKFGRGVIDVVAGGLPWMALLMPVFSLSAPFTNKFIPDLLANSLILAGVAYLWLKRPALSVLTIAVGLLMKPTAVIALTVLLLHPDVLLHMRRWAVAMFIAFAPAALYYTVGVKWLRQFETDGPLFLIHPLNPLQGIVNFWAKADPFGIVNYHGFMPFGWIPLAVLLVPAMGQNAIVRRAVFILLALIILSFSAIGALSGDHAAVHSYYLLGSTPLFALLAYVAWQRHGHWLWRAAFVALVSVRLVEISGLELQGFFKKDAPAQLFARCAEIRARHPELPWGQGLVFRSPYEQYPLLGLCFGERQGSKTAEWGFAYTDSKMPDCEAIDGAGKIVLLRCK